eukprot:Partr_v1_DN21813_c0_g1_i1_m70213 putative Dynein light chain
MTSVETAAAVPASGEPVELADFRKNFNFPLVKFSDMSEEVRVEVVDLVVALFEKHINNYETGAQAIKETLDKKLGSNWHVIVGEGFSFEISHETQNILYMFFGGSVGILVWKAS